MGARCCKNNKDGMEETGLPEDGMEETGLPESDWERLGGCELDQPLRDELVKCVDSRFLVELFRSGGRLERMQDLPSNAFIGLNDLKNLGAYKTTLYEPDGTTYEWLPIAILSYTWLGGTHPDPHAEVLRLLALELMEPHGVIIDFTSCAQVPLTDGESKRFEVLQTFATFYSHPHTLVFQVTEFPDGYPSAKSYDLPEGHTPVTYQDRGWSFAEACLASTGKAPKFLCNLSRLPLPVPVPGGAKAQAQAQEVVGKCMNESTPPPLSPALFTKELAKKAFKQGTDTDTDFARVQKLYEGTYRHRLPDASSLVFVQLNWGPEEVANFIMVICVNPMMRHVDLSSNEVGDEGMKKLCQVVFVAPCLRSLKLVCCKLTDVGASAVGEGLKHNRSLTTLNLYGNQIGDEGARCIAEGLRVDSTLTTLDLRENQIGAEGVRCITEAAKKGCKVLVD